MSMSRNHLVYGSDDTHTIFTRYLTDQLVVRDLRTMKVLRVLGGYKLRNVCICDEYIVTDDGTSSMKVTRITSKEGAQQENDDSSLHVICDPEEVAVLDLSDDLTVDLLYDSAHKQLIVASATGNISLWDLESKELVDVLRDRLNISSISLSGNLLVTGGGGIDDQFINCWDLSDRTRTKMISINYHTIWTYSKVFRITAPRSCHLWSVDALAVSSSTIACNFGYQGAFLVFESNRLKWILNDTYDGGFGGLITPKASL
ncbi:hypothetical protein HDU97_001567 [Phlyctochytrium planicorne]|nr:hypothetical protein HDU97_001567 [Phlyctochytrium planicorne]